jgi:hypothetical protein
MSGAWQPSGGTSASPGGEIRCGTQRATMRTNVLISKTELGKASSRAPVKRTALQAVQTQLPARQNGWDATPPDITGNTWQQQPAHSTSTLKQHTAAASMCRAYANGIMPCALVQQNKRTTYIIRNTAVSKNQAVWDMVSHVACAVVLQVKRTTFNNSSPETTYGAAMPHDAEGAWQGRQAQAYCALLLYAQKAHTRAAA